MKGLGVRDLKGARSRRELEGSGGGWGLEGVGSRKRDLGLRGGVWSQKGIGS